MLCRISSAFATCSLLLCVVLASACGDDGKTSESDSTSGTASTTSASATDTATASGTATETGGAQSGLCIEACETKEDCKIDGVDMGFDCEDVVCVSDGSSAQCDDDDTCVALLSGWTMPCTDQAECPGQVCVEVGGAGLCATAPSDVIMCDALAMDEVTRKAFPGGEDTAVCAKSTAVCQGEVCVVPCQTDDDCASPNYPTCDVNTGQCGCSDDSHCADVPGASICDGGACKCASDGDCEDSPLGDVCGSFGSCGCTNNDACQLTPTFDGTAVTCWTGM